MKLSFRSAVHFTGRSSMRASQAMATSSVYTKIFEPKPPPTSGEMTRNLCSGTPRTNAPMISRWTCGFCDVTHNVSSSVERT